MRETLVQVAARLLETEPPPSRNRSLDALRDPDFARGFALYRRLRALIAELDGAVARGAVVVVEPRQRAGATVMCLQWGDTRARRAAWLEPPVWELLLEHSEPARRLVGGRAVDGAARIDDARRPVEVATIGPAGRAPARRARG